MTPSPARRLLLAALGLAASSVPAFAGWNQVANVTCNDGPIRRAFKPAADCCPDTTPAPTRTSYRVEQEVVRSYYEPITVMKPVTVQEPVDIKVRSYYWEPVQSYTQRSYYDPCSGECQQVAVPRTSYVRREECRTETRYLEKVKMIPVEMQREVTETRPVYTYYGPTTRRYGPTTPASGPSVGEYRGSPKVDESRGGYNNIQNPGLPTTPGGTGLPKKMPEKEIQRIETKSSPSVNDPRFNALSTSISKESGAKVYGEVLATDKVTPLGNAKLVFVNATDLADKKYVTADAFGGFDAKLPAGEWHVYAGPGNGTANYVSKFSVKDGDKQPLGVVTK